MFIYIINQFYNISSILAFSKMQNYGMCVLNDCKTHGSSEQPSYSFTITFINKYQLTVTTKQIYREGYPSYEQHVKEIKKIYNKLLELTK